MGQVCMLLPPRKPVTYALCPMCGVLITVFTAASVILHMISYSGAPEGVGGVDDVEGAVAE